MSSAPILCRSVAADLAESGRVYPEQAQVAGAWLPVGLDCARRGDGAAEDLKKTTKGGKGAAGPHRSILRS